MTGKIPRLEDNKQIKFRKLSKREIASIEKNLAKSFEELKEEEERQEALKWKPKKKKVGTCHCKGNIVLVTTYTSEYDPMSGPPIIGPGSRSQFDQIEHRECFCEGCGLLYNARVIKKKHT